VIVGSLFSGVGGFDLGLEQAGHTVAWQCEADEWRRRVLAARFPGVTCYPDVRELALDRSAETAGDEALRGGRIVWPRSRAVRDESPRHVGHPATADSDARSRRGATSEARDGDPHEAGRDAQAVPGTRGSGDAGADPRRDGSRSDLSDVRRAGNGHRPHHAGGAGWSDGDGQPPTALPGVPHAENASATPWGGDAIGSPQQVDLICGGFP
jgi:hypothetical protein